MAICLELRAGGHSGVRVLTRASVGVMVRFYFAVVLVFFTILCIRIAQMRNGNCIRIRVRVRELGLRSGLRLALGSSLYFYFVEVLCCFLCVILTIALTLSYKTPVFYI